MAAHMKNLLHISTGSPGPLRKMAAFVVTLAMIGLILMFSAVLLAVILAAGAAGWVYLWWKTRALRKQMRNMPPRGVAMEGEVFKREETRGEVIEGEVIRVIDTRNEG
jgi:hypothetical protein